ncbi:DUF305 domain-containing protein [Streptomyces sp. Ru87]|nr:DUF305 domain-containing protein [Streptomyces sp. Ru87]
MRPLEVAVSLRRLPARVRTLAVVLPLAAVTLGLTGCEQEPSAADKAGPEPSVVAPGKPGEAAETLSAEEAKKAVGDDSPNSADFRYVRMMIEHHTQALEMTDLAEKHADATATKRLAERIAASQGPEIKALQGWLDLNEKKEKGQDDASGHGSGHAPGHDHGSMPGMATEQQLEQLSKARGKAFDALFLKLMITHHQGAVTMATELLSEGNNVRVGEMANDVVAQQTAEIGRMRDL